MTTDTSTSYTDFSTERPYRPVRSEPSARRRVAPITKTPSLVPTGWKVAMVFGAFITAILTVLTLLTLHGYIGVNVRIFQGVTGFIGGCQILGLIRMAKRYYSKKKMQKKVLGELLADTPAETEQKKESTLNDKGREWNDQLNTTEAVPFDSTHSYAQKCYNLLDPNQPMAEITPFNMPMVPVMIGKEEEGLSDESILMGVGLPRSQLLSFPKSFAALGQLDDLECMFLVFDNHEQAKTLNLALQAMVFPHYNPIFSDGEEGEIMMMMSNPQGISSPVLQAGLCQPVQLMIGAPEKNLSGNCKFASNHTRFNVDLNADVSSAYFALIIDNDGHKKGVAIHALILNKPKGEQGGATLAQALRQESIGGFLEILSQGHFPNVDQVNKTFTCPCELEQRHHLIPVSNTPSTPPTRHLSTLGRQY